ncbi:MAG: mechanosensitive ion channel family protein [Pseudomonadota bacterium]
MFNFEKYMPWLDSHWHWILQVFIVVLLTALVSFILKKVLYRLLIQSNKTKNYVDDIVVKAGKKPLGWIIWLVGISLAADIIFLQTQSQIFSSVDMLRDIGILIALTWFILGLVKGFEKEYSKKNRGDANCDVHTIEAMSKLIRLALIITAVLVLLQTMGYSISGLLAFGGVGGIAIGFAAKDLLANFFGGLIIYLDRPFKTGDWIRSPDRKIEGTVENIGWRVTQIRTFDKRPLYIPNSIFTSIIVENPSRMLNRRIYETIGIRYDDLEQMDKIVADVKQMLIEHDEIDKQQTMIINFNAFSDSSVDFFVYTFTKTINWVEFHQVKQDVLIKISQIISGHQAEIAFPTTTVHLPEGINSKPA